MYCHFMIKLEKEGQHCHLVKIKSVVSCKGCSLQECQTRFLISALVCIPWSAAGQSCRMSNNLHGENTKIGFYPHYNYPIFPHLATFLHGYIRGIRDILQL